jgi:adenylate cyclase
VKNRVRRRLVLANTAGGLVVLAYVQLTLGTDVAPEASVWLALGLFGVAFAILSVIADIWARKAFSHTVAWIVEDREPTQREAGRVLRMPWRSAWRPLLFWVFGAAVYAALAPTIGGADALSVVEVVNGLVLGGLVTCALGFLLIQRTFTPLVALALTRQQPRRPISQGVRMRLAMTWAGGSSVPLLGFALDAVGPGDRMPQTAVLLLALAGLGAGFLATIATAHALAVPLDSVRDAMGRVRDGDLSVSLVVDDGGEIGEMQAGFNNMVGGLRDREQIRDLFGRHVGQEVANHALERGTGLGGEQRDASIVFVDLVGSTAMAELLPPCDVVDTLNDFFAVVVRVVDSHGGWVNKFEGDGALCVFGVPGAQPDHADRALRAARRLYEAMDSLAERHPGLSAGIGVSSGHVVAGNVGTESRYEYTVIGPAVNEASRLTDVAKNRIVKALASGTIVERADDEAANWRGVGTVSVRGRSAPTVICEPICETEPVIFDVEATPQPEPATAED